MMHIQGILDFLKQLAVNNNREWFQAHKDTYLSVQKDFEDLLALVIARISLFDDSVAHVQPLLIGFYRDVRFSADKSPYKTHIGGYINARGKKSIIVGIIFIWSRVIVCWQGKLVHASCNAEGSPSVGIRQY